MLSYSNYWYSSIQYTWYNIPFTLTITNTTTQEYRIKRLITYTVAGETKTQKYIIIDEMSMLGQQGLSWIDKRLKQATGHYKQPFGGLSIILIETMHNYHLLVTDLYTYICPNTQNQDYNDGYLLFRLFNTVVQLKQLMRQNNSTHKFRELLTAIHNGQITQQHWHTLLARTPSKVPDIF